MSALEVFQFDDLEVRTATLACEPAVVLSDLAKVLGYRSAADAARILREHHRGYAEVRTPGGTQRMIVVTERGVNRLLMRSGASNAERVQDWLSDDVMPAIRSTGTYSAPVEVSRRDLALAILAAEDEADRQRERAEVAESFKAAIESNEGRSVRAFHKHYFADTPERDFFAVLYSRGLLIDQRKKGARRADGSFRDGSQHGHPTAEGKHYFYIDAGVVERTGYRYEQARVRPGDPELALVATLSRRGLTPTRAISTELAHV